MERKTDSAKSKFIYLSAKDLALHSRNKPFNEISLTDFRHYDKLMNQCNYKRIFFIDDRHKSKWWNKLFGIGNYVGNRVKIIL